MPVNYPEEFLKIKRLREVIGCARRKHPLGFARRGIGADDHDRDFARGVVTAQPAQHLAARNVGQIQVEEDQPVPVLACEV